MTTIPATASTLVLRDSDDIGYEHCTTVQWVFEDADGSWVGTAPVKPGRDVTIGEISSALGVDTDRLTPEGYVSGGAGVFLRATEFAL